MWRTRNIRHLDLVGGRVSGGGSCVFVKFRTQELWDLIVIGYTYIV